MTNASSLREALSIPPDPPFEMDLPPGWSRREPDDDTLRDMLAELRQRAMRHQRPDLYAHLKPALEASFEDMRGAGVFAFFSPADPDPGTLWLPTSISASIRRAEPGETLDALVRTLVRQYGAQPLLDDRRTLWFEREETRRAADGSIVAHSRVYLTPMPGSRRRRALQLVAGFGRDPQTPADDPALERLRGLLDACVSTVRWYPAGAAS
ncbi:protein TPRXL [Microbacterium album]|uniref:Uncharacterized protein n=1 Tax=Microbacterium album TaxID=2053191 RepID=A0A917IDT1_9MICO|nr:protein TPRXL [Microbacterium album]GGH42873.1 hypothetical protein GCM10010921_16360 [Microbacterium album]